MTSCYRLILQQEVSFFTVHFLGYSPNGFHGEAFFYRLFHRRRRLFRFLCVVINILDNDADNDHQRHGEKHARRVEEASAEEQAEKDGDWVQV